jgi:hypothetical protein
MSERLWKDLEDSRDRRPIVISTLARKLRLELLEQMRVDGQDNDVVVPASRVADLHPRFWHRAERIRAMALSTVELDTAASATALELMSREVTRMLETLVRAAHLSTGAPRPRLEAECTESGTWML